MLTQEEDVEITALRKRGWSLSAIARHLGISRNTVKVYARGERSPARRRTAPDPIQPYVEYIGIRLRDDPHVWGSALNDEVRRPLPTLADGGPPAPHRAAGRDRT